MRCFVCEGVCSWVAFFYFGSVLFPKSSLLHFLLISAGLLQYIWLHATETSFSFTFTFFSVFLRAFVSVYRVLRLIHTHAISQGRCRIRGAPRTGRRIGSFRMSKQKRNQVVSVVVSSGYSWINLQNAALLHKTLFWSPDSHVRSDCQISPIVCLQAHWSGWFLMSSGTRFPGTFTGGAEHSHGLLVWRSYW